MSADEEAIRNLVALWHSATAAGDVKTILGLMAEDVVFLVAGQPPTCVLFCADRREEHPRPVPGGRNDQRARARIVPGRAGRILCTANGTRAAEILQETGVEHVLVGCMRNAAAVMDAAIRLAARLDRSLSLVCAGREACRIPALDDVCCAAALLTYGEKVARTLGREPVVMESGRIARFAQAAFPGIREAFEQSATAEVLRRVDSAADIAFCAEETVSPVVPTLTFRTRLGLISIGPYEERP